MGLDRLLARAAALWPEHVAVIIGGEPVAYAQLDAAASRIAGQLRAAGLEPGERVPLLTGTNLAFLSALFGIARAGAVPVPLNSWLGPSELRGLIAGTGSRLLACDAEHADLAAAAAPAVPRWFPAGAASPPAPAASVAPLTGPPGDGLQLYTSGTTGLPKGVVLTRDGVAVAAMGGALEKDLRPDDRLLHSAPLFFSGTLMMLATFMAAGGSVEFQPRFDPERTWQRLGAGDITVLSGVPTMLYALLESAPAGAGRRFSPRLVNYGGAPMSPDLLTRVLEQWGCAFWQGYGLTEAAVSVTALRPADHVAAGSRPQWLRSVGRPLLHVRLRGVGPSGADVAPGEEGEISISGASVMRGYWQRPEATAETLRDGWLYTGDLATVDEQGYIYILGRRSETIISGGVNVYPGEVEDVLRQHQAVRDCAVLGLPDGRWGELVTAVIVPRAPAGPGEALTAELLAHCRASLARFKVPKRFEFVSALPSGASGKVQKQRLREQLLAVQSQMAP